MNSTLQQTIVIDNSDLLLSRLIHLHLDSDQLDKIFTALVSKSVPLSKPPSRILSSAINFKDSPEGFNFWWEKKMQLEEIEVREDNKIPSKHYLEWKEKQDDNIRRT